MKLLAIMVFSLAAAVVLGQLISDDPGFVVIGYGGKVLRTSFAFFAATLVTGLAVLYLVWRILYQLFTLKKRWRGWSARYRSRRSQRALSNGLIAMAEGKYRRAEQLLLRGADSGAAHYLGAAEAAQAQNATDRRDSYLSLAREAMPSADVAIGIKRAQMQLADGEYEQARATLEYLADRHPDNRQVLSLQEKAYQAVNDGRALLGLLPALRRHRVYDTAELSALESKTAKQVLSVPYPSDEELREIWQRLPKSARAEPGILASFTRQLAAFGFHEEAENLLRKHLTRHWDAELVRQYGDVRIQNADLQLERAETWLATRTDDPDLLLCLAKLSMAAENWDKARSYLNSSIGLAPSPVAYKLLADVHERAQDTEAAHRARREGLQLATAPLGGLPVLRP